MNELIFRRPHHNAVLAILRDLQGDLLADCECYFGGGTAIVLGLDEYRESIDIDFLCASQAGYRSLRMAVAEEGISGLLKPGSAVKPLREMRADQYGLRTLLGFDGVSVKFEIVREARIALSGALDPTLGVPVLGRDDMYAEKLLANADRWADRAVFSRDILDLTMMQFHWGDIPPAAWQKAGDAYGPSAARAYGNAVRMIRDRPWLETCLRSLQMAPQLADRVLDFHGGAIVRED